MMPDIHDKAQDHPAASILLLVFGWFTNSLSDLTIGDVYEWIFKAMSLTSLGLIIAINWRRGVDEIKAVFTKK